MTDWIWREKACQVCVYPTPPNQDPWGSGSQGRQGIASLRCWFVMQPSSSGGDETPTREAWLQPLISQLEYKLQMSFLPGTLICYK